ncbi:uncharacterized protein AMSG_05709 [Thecamonas trahens ATCC 50062]|uniref:DUF294 domain-containing protein n=1 Tax=Thecamonas trahens ATCC 50062 TaxID=461836 RepID=A0A0L0DC48_THETB|nr:hypothetical protein AMSG_05709 [Thecamonas trahens ATCC 50062]KNC49656.1 hypothetical protein AMSG_05709 [Thecamonas trahens ATCC 50062]|eukprot:XP_013757755.1 hypothetical protein AMSG_05709 [Thecamonas trahens ATCC 50062]
MSEGFLSRLAHTHALPAEDAVHVLQQELHDVAHASEGGAGAAMHAAYVAAMVATARAVATGGMTEVVSGLSVLYTDVVDPYAARLAAMESEAADELRLAFAHAMLDVVSTSLRPLADAKPGLAPDLLRRSKAMLERALMVTISLVDERPAMRGSASLLLHAIGGLVHALLEHAPEAARLSIRYATGHRPAMGYATSALALDDTHAARAAVTRALATYARAALIGSTDALISIVASDLAPTLRNTPAAQQDAANHWFHRARVLYGVGLHEHAKTVAHHVAQFLARPGLAVPGGYEMRGKAKALFHAAVGVGSGGSGHGACSGSGELIEDASDYPHLFLRLRYAVGWVRHLISGLLLLLPPLEGVPMMLADDAGVVYPLPEEPPRGPTDACPIPSALYSAFVSHLHAHKLLPDSLGRVRQVVNYPTMGTATSEASSSTASDRSGTSGNDDSVVLVSKALSPAELAAAVFAAPETRATLELACADPLFPGFTTLLHLQHALMRALLAHMWGLTDLVSSTPTGGASRGNSNAKTEYAFVALGSFSRMEACPFSDLDAILLVDPNAPPSFRDGLGARARFFELLVMSLGETQFHVVKDWHHRDVSIIESGFDLDEAHLSPVRTIVTPDELITLHVNAATELLKYEYDNVDPFTHAAREPSLVFGSARVFASYQAQLKQLFTSAAADFSPDVEAAADGVSLGALYALTTLDKNTGPGSAFAPVHLTTRSRDELSIKTHAIRFVTMTVGALALYLDGMGIEVPETVLRLQRLAQARLIPPRLAIELIRLHEWLFRTRFALHLSARRENDVVSRAAHGPTVAVLEKAASRILSPLYEAVRAFVASREPRNTISSLVYLRAAEFSARLDAVSDVIVSDVFGEAEDGSFDRLELLRSVDELAFMGVRRGAAIRRLHADVGALLFPGSDGESPDRGAPNDDSEVPGVESFGRAHVVYARGVHFKLYPLLPGHEISVSLLAQSLFSEYTLTPLVDVAVVRHGGREHLLLMGETISRFNMLMALQTSPSGQLVTGNSGLLEVLRGTMGFEFGVPTLPAPFAQLGTSKRPLEPSTNPSMARDERICFRSADGELGVNVALDMEQYSAAVLLALCVNPEDGKPDNHVVMLSEELPRRATPMVTEVADGKRAVVTYRAQVVSVDNEYGFVEATKASCPQVKSIYFCMSALSLPVPVHLRKVVTRWDARHALASWLQHLQAAECEFKHLGAAIGDDELGVRFVAGIVHVLFHKLARLRRALQIARVTHRELLFQMERELAEHYLSAFKDPKLATPIERMLKIASSNYQQRTVLTSLLATARLVGLSVPSATPDLSEFVTLTSAETIRNSQDRFVASGGAGPSQTTYDFAALAAARQDVLTHGSSSSVATLVEAGTAGERVGPDELLIELELLQEGENALEALIEHGDLRPFQALHLPQFKEAALKRLHLDKLGAELQRSVLKAIDGTLFVELHLPRCGELSDSVLKSIVSKCPALVELNVAHCSRIVSVGSVGIYAPLLQVLDVSHTSVTLKALDGIEASAPHLTWLNIEGVAAIADSPRRIFQASPGLVWSRLPLRLQYGLVLLHECAPSAQASGAVASLGSIPLFEFSAAARKRRKKHDKKVVAALKERWRSMAASGSRSRSGSLLSSSSAGSSFMASFKASLSASSCSSMSSLEPSVEVSESQQVQFSVDLGHPPMATAGLGLLDRETALASFVMLVELDLVNTGLRVLHASVLCELLCDERMQQLRKLNVSWNELGNIGTSLLAQVWSSAGSQRSFVGLQVLDMRFNAIDDHGYENLASIREHEPPSSPRYILFDEPYSPRPRLLSLHAYETSEADWELLARARKQKVSAMVVLRTDVVVVGTPSGAVYAWDVHSGSEPTLVANLHSAVHGLLQHPMDRSLVVATASGAFQLDVWSGVELNRMELLSGVEARVVASIGLCATAVGCSDGVVRFWDTGSNEVLSELDTKGGAVTALTLLGDGTLAIGFESGTVEIVELAGGRCVLSLTKGHRAAVTSVTDMGDGHVVSTGADGRMLAWDLRLVARSTTHRVVFEMRRSAPASAIRAAIRLPDGALFAVATQHSQQSLHLVDIDGGLVATFEGELTRSVSAIGMLPTGELVTAARAFTGL